MKRLIIEPKGWPCTLAECAPGLFVSGETVGIKTEYPPPNARCEDDVDAYVAASGERFWGGKGTTEGLKAMIVQPCTYCWEDME